MAAAHLAYPDLAVERFSGNDPDQDVDSFVQLIERKINFSLGDGPANAEQLVDYNFRIKAHFSSLLRGPAAERYGSIVYAATPWEDIRSIFITRFADGRNILRHRLAVEHCIRRDGEKIRKFIHRVKRTVEQGWPDDMNGISNVNKMRNEQDKEDKGDNGTWTTVWKDLDLDTSNRTLKSV